MQRLYNTMLRLYNNTIYNICTIRNISKMYNACITKTCHFYHRTNMFDVAVRMFFPLSHKYICHHRRDVACNVSTIQYDNTQQYNPQLNQKAEINLSLRDSVFYSYKACPVSVLDCSMSSISTIKNYTGSFNFLSSHAKIKCSLPIFPNPSLPKRGLTMLYFIFARILMLK